MTDVASRFAPPLPVVEAKLHPPAQHPGTVDRTRLVDALLAEPGPPVISMIAPAGYGKTTVLAQWARRERRPFAWLTIDDLDNDPAVLLAYLSVAFDRIEPIEVSMTSALAAPRERILATAVPRLLSELSRWDRPAVLVLDDVHRLDDRTSLDALATLLDRLPIGFRVAIAGRARPDLPLGRLRAERELLEIGPRELALDDGEAGALVAAVGLALSPDETRALTEQAEGWAAGIYLAALAHERGGAGPTPPGTVSGRDRYIAEYLRSEIVGKLDDDDVAFLTRTAILETVSPAVAEAVSGLPGAEQRLRSLAHRTLLIQDVGGSAAAHRYHNLLRDFLQGELEAREPNGLLELHRRAASWYAGAGIVDLAVKHAFASGDRDAAARLVTAAALPTFYGGHPATVDRWIQRFETTDVERHPPLAVIAAWLHLLNGRAHAADLAADIAERATFSGSPGDGSASFESQRAMLRAMMARRGPADVLANAELAVATEPTTSPWRSNALWLLGSAHRLLGDTDAADETFADAVAAGATASSGTATVATAARAAIAMARGDWEAAETFALQSRAQLKTSRFEEIIASLIVYAVSARVASHRGDHARARAELVRAQLIRPLVSHAAPWYAVDALLELARAYLATSDHAGAQVVVREAELIARRRPALGTLTTDLDTFRGRLAGAAATLAGSSALTTAELRILPLLTTYLSFQDIADRLVVSRNTVKTHAMSIYGKLQASSRGEAVERAVELGLLEPFPGFVARPHSPEG